MRRVVVVLFLLAASVGLAAGPAQAGGPTSVLLASPTLDTAAALYNAGGDYARLAAAVGLSRPLSADPNVPHRLGIGPGSDAINVTWLAHDVWIWRVDRVHIQPDGSVWLNTMLANDRGELPYESGGVWHQAVQPKQVIALFMKLGVWDGKAEVAFSRPAMATGPEIAAPRLSGTSAFPWLPAALALVVGMGVGLAIRPALDFAARMRSRGPRQQLIDARGFGQR